MATTKRLVRNLRDSKNIDILQLLKSFIYGDNVIIKYKESTSYSKNDVVIKFDSSTNRFVTYRCIVSRSSTTWNQSEWIRETAVTNNATISDKLVVHSTSQPTDTINKLWFNDTKTNANGTINTTAKIKNEKGTYETLYLATITDNVFTTPERTQTLTQKISEMDNGRGLVQSGFLMDTLDLLFDLGVIIPNSKTQKFITILNPSATTDITISGNVFRHDGIISI